MTTRPFITNLRLAPISAHTNLPVSSPSFKHQMIGMGKSALAATTAIFLEFGIIQSFDDLHPWSMREVKAILCQGIIMGLLANRIHQRIINGTSALRDHCKLSLIFAGMITSAFCISSKLAISLYEKDVHYKSREYTLLEMFIITSFFTHIGLLGAWAATENRAEQRKLYRAHR